MSSTDLYAVFGHPISHSQSPRIHALFAEQCGETLRYIAQDVPAETFDHAIEAFIAAGGRGLNCTVPLKQLAWQMADHNSERAERSQAVNTLLIDPESGELSGDNTDGIGLVRDLTDNQQIKLCGRQILLLGAGGASCGILSPLLEQQPERLVIANRTVAKATELAGHFSDLGAVSACSFEALAGDRFDLILNATSASLSNQCPPLPDTILAPAGNCYDLAYGKEPTAFVRWAEQQGADNA